MQGAEVRWKGHSQQCKMILSGEQMHLSSTEQGKCDSYDDGAALAIGPGLGRGTGAGRRTLSWGGKRTLSLAKAHHPDMQPLLLLLTGMKAQKVGTGHVIRTSCRLGPQQPLELTLSL